jgi:hypothetical protein
MSNESIIEHFAIRAALGNNGGNWADHYTEAQKEYWRRFVRDMVVHIKIGLANNNLVSVGELATREMAENGEQPNPAFHQAAIKAARAAGLSDDDIAELYDPKSKT